MKNLAGNGGKFLVKDEVEFWYKRVLGLLAPRYRVLKLRERTADEINVTAKLV